MRRRRDPEIIAGRVNSDGSIAAGDGFTVQKTATGVYTISFSSGFRPLAASGAIISQYVFWAADTFADRSFRVTISSTLASFTGNDQGFSFIAVGVQQ